MFQGTQGNINVSTSASTDEISLFNQLEMGDLKNFSNPVVGKMPFGHEGYTEADKEKCPVMSGMIKPPVQEENEDDDDTDSNSSGEEEEEEELEMPSGHEGYSDQDKDKCPVLSGKIKMPQRDGQGDTVNKKKKKKKIQSGCPFMPAETKKDPGLTHLEPSYEIPYISTLRHLFTFKGIGQKGKACPSNREKFDSYPIFLRHTLFHDQEKFSKVRKCEMTQKFFIYDNFREQGNKRYHKNKLDEAIALYEHGLSCFKWLEMKPEEKKEGDEEKKEDEYDALASLKPLNKALITILSDDNVRLCDGEDVTEKSDIDLRTSMVLSAHLSLACCYLKLNHYSTAIIALEEGMKINNTSSQFYFRRSQARAYNKGSTLEDLYLAKEDIEKAIDMKHTEKLFQQEPSVLKILNVHNAGEVYVEHAHFVDKVIKEKKDEIKAGLKQFFSKIKEIEFVEEAMIQDGEVMNDTDRHTVEICADEDMEEFDLIKEMLSKYYKIIEFYIETDKKDQIKIARKEVQTVLEAYHKMKQLLSLDFKNYEKNPILVETANDFQIDLSKPKVQKRLDKMRISKVKDIFDNGHFNMEVFQYAYKDYSKKKQEKEKAQKEKAKKLEGAEKPKAGFLKTILGAEFGLQMLVLALLFALFWLWNKNRLSGADSVLSKGI